MRRALCALLGHRYVDNGPGLRQHVPDAVPTRAWCGRCSTQLRLRYDERAMRAMLWSTGWEGR